LEQLQRQLDQSSVDLRRIDEEIDDARVRARSCQCSRKGLKALLRWPVRTLVGLTRHMQRRASGPAKKKCQS
jgi:hypothetical protein